MEDIDRETLSRWLGRTARATPDEIARIQGRHPDASLEECAREAGWFSDIDLPRLTRDVLEGLGIPDRIGPLVIEGEIGRGGMGIVLRARDEDLQRDVAVKLLPGALALHAETRERFARECRAVAKLDHPGIVRLYSTGDHDGIAYAVLEHIAGRTIDAGGLAGRDRTGVLLAFAEVADALAYAHAQGVIHRDVKPSNIMIDESGRAHLLDFGLALVDDADRITFSGDMMGTPAYMSPEQAARGRLASGPATDIYSLGVSIYEALTGRLPFADPNRAALFQQVLFRDPAPPAVSPEIDAIVLQCLRKNPEDRYESAGALAADLRRAAAGEPVAATRWGLSRRAINGLRRIPARVGHGRAAMTILCAAGAIWVAVLVLAAPFPSMEEWLSPLGWSLALATCLPAFCLAARGAVRTPLRQDPLRMLSMPFSVQGLLACSAPASAWVGLWWLWTDDVFAVLALLLSGISALVWGAACVGDGGRPQIRLLAVIAALNAALSACFGGWSARLAVGGLWLPAIMGTAALLLARLGGVRRPGWVLWFLGHVAAGAGLTAFLRMG